MGAMRGKSKINHMQRAELEYGVAERGPLAFLLAGGDEAKQSTSVNSNTVICQLEEDQPRKKKTWSDKTWTGICNMWYGKQGMCV